MSESHPNMKLKRRKLLRLGDSFFGVEGLLALVLIPAFYLISSVRASVLLFADMVLLPLGVVITVRIPTRRLIQAVLPTSLEDDLRQRVQLLASKMGVTSVDFRVVDRFIGSINARQFGVRRRLITISARLVEQLSFNELDAIIAHELAHVKRNHVLKKALVNCLSVLAGVNFLWLASYSVPLTTEWNLLFISGLLALFAVTFVAGALTTRIGTIEADETTVRTIGSKDSMISALSKLDALALGSQEVVSHRRILIPSLSERVVRIRDMD